MVKITKTVVEAMPVCPEGPKYLWDGSLAGFGVKALPSGKKQYVVKYRVGGGGRSAAQRWMKLGTHGQITCEAARALAKKALGEVAHGSDPQKSKDESRRSATLADAWARFASNQSERHGQSTRGRRSTDEEAISKTHREYTRQWVKLIGPKLGRIPVRSIETEHIERLRMSLMQTPYQANRVVALISRLLSLCEIWGWRDQRSNPCRNVEKFKEVSRETFLSDEELKRVGVAMDELVERQALSKAARNALRLLLLTGGRLNEILEAKVSAIDRTNRTLHLPHSKTGKRDIFLSAAALVVIEEQLVVRQGVGGDQLFPGAGESGALVNLRKPWMRVCEQAGLKNVRLHDLRHTAASVAIKRGASLPMVGRMLGHTQAQTTKRYAHVADDVALATVERVGDAMSSALAITGLQSSKS